MWETKEGDLNLRPKTKAALLSLRGIGVREAKKRLAEGQGETKGQLKKARKQRR
jgi:ribosomal protein L4